MIQKLSRLTLLQHFNRFQLANLNQAYINNRNRDAVVFTNQRTKWTQNELNIQTTSFVRGLKNM